MTKKLQLWWVALLTIDPTEFCNNKKKKCETPVNSEELTVLFMRERRFCFLGSLVFVTFSAY